MRIRERILETVIGVALGLFISYLCHRPHVKVEKEEIFVKDTITIIKTDTIVHYEPKVSKEVVRDSIIICVKDTVYLALPRVVREYHDRDYHARVSGVDPKLDYIKTFPRTEYKYITQTEKVLIEPKKWAIYANADYIYATKDFQALPVSIGLSYTPKNAKFYIEYGKELLKNIEFVRVGTDIPLVSF